ncbi:MAG TPA: hypothetical protein DF613_11720 [Lachnospiraceae bacterium]|nr:hypothetical protein [Lachnospiraceae bacterium]
MYIVKQVIDALYPPACPLCGKLLEKGETMCVRCRSRLQVVAEPRCMCCGRPLPDQGQEYCPDCASMHHWFDQGAGVFPYQSAVRRMVMDLKFRGKTANARLLGRWMAAYVKPEIALWRPDVLVPVPLHSRKLRKRGYNQARLLAESVGKILDIPVDAAMVRRKGSTEAQMHLGRLARQRNLEQAFAMGKNRVAEGNILLVDDIYTTGSTADAVARVLKENGAGKVYVLTACIGSDF